MFGAEYILNLFNSNPNQIAEEFQLRRQSVYEWFKKKRIPPKRIKQLSEKFGIPEEYFCKDLTRSDELRIQAIKLRNEDIDHVVQILNEEGEIEEATINENEQLARSLLEKSEHLATVDNLFSRIKSLIEQDDENFIYEGVPEYKSNLQILESVTGVLASKDKDTKDVLNILTGFFDLDNLEMDENMMLAFFSKEEISKSIPYYKKAFADDLMQLLLDHGIIKKIIFKKYLEDKNK